VGERNFDGLELVETQKKAAAEVASLQE